MSSFGGIYLTNNGRTLQVKAQLGKALKFTRIALGDGDLGSSSIVDVTKLKHEVKSLNITKFKSPSAGNVVVGGVLTNSNLTSGFYWRELGLMAEDPDTGQEVLYSYGNAKSNAEYIPAGNGPDIVEKAIDVLTLIGNAQNVSAVINNSLIFETPEGAQEKADIAYNSSKTYTDGKITDVEKNIAANATAIDTQGKDNTKKFTEIDNNIKSLNKIKKNVTITAAGWTMDEALQLYKYRINDADISSSAVVDVNIRLADLEKASDIKSANESFDGYLILYSDGQPIENITCDYVITKQVV